jgi:type IV secretion system protein VirD4
MFKRAAIRICGLMLTIGGIGLALYIQSRGVLRLWDSSAYIYFYRYGLATRTVPPMLLSIALPIFVGGLITTFIAERTLRRSRAYGRAQIVRGARWLKKLALDAGSGFVLGRVGNRLAVAGELSALVIGPAGTGKSTCVLIPTILSMRNRSQVIHDPKGELTEAVAGHLAGYGDYHLINLAAGPSHSAKFNPIARQSLPTNSSARGDAIDGAWTFLLPSKPGGSGDSASFFTDMGRSLGSALTLWEIYDAESRNTDASFPMVLDRLTRLGTVGADPDDNDAIGTELMEMANHAEDSGWPARIATALRQIAPLDYRTRSNVSATSYQGLKPFLNQAVADCVSGCDFSYADFRGRVVGRWPFKRRRPIYVAIKSPPKNQEVSGALLALFVDGLTRYLTQRLPKKGELGVTYMMDEFYYMPPSKDIVDGPAILRGYGIRILAAIQSWSQVVAVYGEHKAKILWENMAYKALFTQNDFGSAKLVSDLVGNLTRDKGSETIRGINEVSEGRSDEGYAALPPQEVLNLKKGYVIIIRQGAAAAPLVTKAAFWKRLPYYLRRRCFKRLPATIKASLRAEIV